MTRQPIVLFMTLLAAAIVADAGTGFVPNRGQVATVDGHPAMDVRFHAMLAGMDVAVFDDGWSYILHRPAMTAKADRSMTSLPDGGQVLYRVDVRLRGSRPPAAVMVDGRDDGVHHVYDRHCPDGVTDLPSYRRVTLGSVYPGIDVVLSVAPDGTLKYDVVVRPGGDPSAIVLDVAGATVHAADHGGYHLATPWATITEGVPVCWTEHRGGRTPVVAHCDVSQSSVRFVLAPYDPSHVLVIDPAIEWCTFHGGSRTDLALDVAAGPDNMPVITGQTSSPDIPVTAGVEQVSPGGIMVAKYDISGALVWSTYYSGSGGYGVAVDRDNNVYVTGWTGRSIPVSDGAYQATAAGSFDAFLIGFDSAGKRRFATHLGGAENDVGVAVAVNDQERAVYITGRAQSDNLPVTGNAYQRRYGGASVLDAGGAQAGDVFLLRATMDGMVTLVTYYGGRAMDEAYGIRVAGDSIVYICGRTSSNALPGTQQGLFPRSSMPPDEAFVACLDGRTGSPIWASYFGGSGYDAAYDLDIFGMYDIVNDRTSIGITVVGRTTSEDLPVHNAFQPAYAGGKDSVNGGDAMLLSMFDTFVDGTNGNLELVRLTYLGTPEDDGAMDVAFNHVLVNSAGDFGLGSTPGGGTDAWVIQAGFGSRPSMAWAIGGAADDFSPFSRTSFITYNMFGLGGIVRTSDDAVYVAGYTESTTLPMSEETGRQPRNNGSHDGFLAKLGCYSRGVDVAIVPAACPHDWPAIEVTDAATSVVWGDGTTGRRYNAEGPGPYRVRIVRVGGCVDSATITVERPEPADITVVVHEPHDDACGEGLPSALSASYPGVDCDARYLWSDGVVGRMRPVTSPGTYTVTVIFGPDCSLTSAPVTVTGSGGGVVPSGMPVLGDATLVAGTGDVIALPLRIEGAADVAALPVSWEARLRLDASVFYPLPPAVAGAIVNGTRDVVLRGDRPATSAELATLECVVALGERSTAAIDLVSFVWTLCSDTVAGRGTVVDVENVCAAGGRERLFRDGASAGVAIRPNPAVGGVAVVVVDAQERGQHTVMVVDGTGRHVADLGRYTLSRGSQATITLLPTLAAGQYRVVVTGPTTLATTILTVLP